MTEPNDIKAQASADAKQWADMHAGPNMAADLAQMLEEVRMAQSNVDGLAGLPRLSSPAVTPDLIGNLQVYFAALETELKGISV